jgi:hypothetical protein
LGAPPPEPDSKFAKGVAVVLTDNDDNRQKVLRKIANAFLLEGLPAAPRAVSKRALSLIDTQGVVADAETGPRDEEGKKVTTEVAAFLSILSDPRGVSHKPQKPVMSSIARQTLSLVHGAASRWGSAKPILGSKMLQLLAAAEEWRTGPVRTDQLPSILHWSGSQIQSFRAATQKSLSPIERLSLFKLKHPTEGDLEVSNLEFLSTPPKTDPRSPEDVHKIDSVVPNMPLPGFPRSTNPAPTTSVSDGVGESKKPEPQEQQQRVSPSVNRRHEPPPAAPTPPTPQHLKMAALQHQPRRQMPSQRL